MLVDDISRVVVTEDMAKCLLTSYESLRGRLQTVIKVCGNVCGYVCGYVWLCVVVCVWVVVCVALCACVCVV